MNSSGVKIWHLSYQLVPYKPCLHNAILFAICLNPPRQNEGRITAQLKLFFFPSRFPHVAAKQPDRPRKLHFKRKKNPPDGGGNEDQAGEWWKRR